MDQLPPRDEPDREARLGLSRREVLQTTVAAGTFAAVARADAAPTDADATHAEASAMPATVPVAMTVNGNRVELALDPRTTLLDALREHLRLTGTKKGCDHGQCGACTVIADGMRINSCLSLAVLHDGGEVTTIEGLGTPERLHPMQAAFVRHDGYQCGYCTPGQICSAVAMLGEARAGWPSVVSPDLAAHAHAAFPLDAVEIRERMSGNICRCAAYPNIVAAIEEVGGVSAPGRGTPA